LPIDGDNAFHLLSVKAILKTGLPLMPDGDLYLRALPLMYLEALSLKIFGVSELSLGLPNAFIGTLNILLVYFLVMTIWRDKNSAILTALFFSISPWAIAVARMPRMYEPFLMSALLIWILFYKWFYLNKKKLIIPLIIVALLAISLHKIAILPISCLILPLLFGCTPQRNCFASCAIFIVLFAVWINYKSLLGLMFQ
jgi:4-amino-4-deoxy-L-arabinose transferase-like glycosyltransferase